MTGSSGVSDQRPSRQRGHSPPTRRAEAWRRRPSGAPHPRPRPARCRCALCLRPRRRRSWRARPGAGRPSRPPRRWRPNKASLRITLGNLALRQGDDEAAERAFCAALEQAPGSVAAHTNLGAALKRQGRLEEAVQCYRAALALYRGSAWWGTDPASGTAVLDPAQQATFQNASRVKFEHDLAQLDYLLERGRLPPSLAKARESPAPGARRFSATKTGRARCARSRRQSDG